MIAAICLALAAASSSSSPVTPAADEDDRKRVVVLDLGGDAVGSETKKSITALVVVKLSHDPRLDVVSGQDLKGLVNLEVAKQAAGCDDSCLAELAGAMDARLVVTGFVGRLGSLYVVNLSLFDAKKTRAVGRATVEAERVEDFATKLDVPIDAMLRDLPAPKKHARIDDVDARSSQKPAPYLAMGLTGGGALVAVVGGALLLGAGAMYADAESARSSLDAAAHDFNGNTGSLATAHDAYVSKRDAYNGTGTSLEWAGVAAGLVGVAVAGAGAALWVTE